MGTGTSTSATTTTITTTTPNNDDNDHFMNMNTNTQERFNDHPTFSSSTTSLVPIETTTTIAAASLPRPSSPQQKTLPNNNPRHNNSNGIRNVREFEDDVWCIAHSNDGNYLASGGCDKTLTITNTSTNEIFKQQSFDDTITAISFSEDNQVLAVGGWDCKVSFFGANKYERTNEPIRMKNWVWTLSFSKSSKWLFVGGHGYFCILIRSKNGKNYEIHKEQQEQLDGKAVLASSFSCTNDDIIHFSIDSVVRRYNIATNTILQEYQQNDMVHAIQLSPCGQYMFIGGQENNFQVYHIITNSMIYEHVHDDWVLSICYSKENNFIIVGDRSGKVTFYDISTYCKIHEFKMNGLIESISTQSSNPSNIAIANEKTAIQYDAGCTALTRKNTTWDEYGGHTYNAVVYSSSGNEFACGGHDRYLYVLDMKQNELKQEIGIDGGIYALKYSLDDSILLCGTAHGTFYFFTNTNTYEKEELDVKNINKVEGHWTYNTLNFFDDYLAVLGNNGKNLNLYKLLKKKSLGDTNKTCFQEKYLFEFDDDEKINAIDFSESLNTLAIGTKDGISLYNAKDNTTTVTTTCFNKIEEIFKLIEDHGVEGGIDLIHCSPKGKLIAYGKRGSKHIYVRGYDTSSCKMTGKLEVIDAKDIISLQFSPDGKVLAIGSRNGILELICVEDFSEKEVVLAEANDADGVQVLPWKQFCMSIFFPTCEMIKEIIFDPSQVPGHEKRETESVNRGGGNTNDIDSNDFYHLVIRYKEYQEVMRYMDVHLGSKCPMEYLLQRYNHAQQKDDQDKIIELIQDPANNYYASFIRDENSSTLMQLALEKGMLGRLLSSNGEAGYSSEPILLSSITCTPATEQVQVDIIQDHIDKKQVEYNQSILKKLVDKYLFDDLSTIAKFDLRATTELNILHHLNYTLQDLAHKEQTSTATKLLNAEIHLGEKYKGIDCPEGFIVVDDFYAKMPNSDGNMTMTSLIKSWFMKCFSLASKKGSNKNGTEQSVPVVDEQDPRTSDNPFDLRHTCWKDLIEDQEQRVQLYILRVYLPNLGSFESLKTFTTMTNSKLFDSRALHTVLDTLWNNFARTWFLIQFGIYCLMLISFTSFCEITKYHVFQKKVLHKLGDLTNNHDVTLLIATSYPMIVYILSGIITCTLLLLGYVEVRQIHYLGQHYWTKFWNPMQWLSIVFVALTMVLRLTTTTATIIYDEDDATEKWISVISAFALLLTWFGLFSYLRGFEDFAWIIMALQRITVSFRYFLMVVLLVIASFAMAFRALYRAADEDILVVHSNDVGGNSYDHLLAYMDIAVPFANIFTSLLRTFMAGILGDVDTDEFWKTYSIIISIVLLSFMLFFVLIIAMNALIAFISERFEVVLDEKNAVLKAQKADMILDILCLFSKETRREIEIANQWTSIVIPAASLSTDDRAKPVLENLSRVTKEDLKKVEKKFEKRFQEMDVKVEKMDMKVEKKLQDLENEVNEMKSDLKKILHVLSKGQK